MSNRQAIQLCDVQLLKQLTLQRTIAVMLLAGLCCGHPSRVLAQSAEASHIGPSPAPSNSATGEKFTVTGTVIDAVTGEAVRKALVQLNGQQRRTAFSDGDGRFQFEGILAGTVSLSAQKPGYFSDQDLLRGGAQPVEVGPNTESAVVKLTPEAIIAGKVATTAGAPLEHVSLNLTYIEIREGRRRWDSKGSAITDEDGRYRFANLRPGSYYVSAAQHTPRLRNMVEVEPAPKTGYPGVYFPGVPDLASASPIQLSAGQLTEANFALSEVPVYAISGTISGNMPNEGVGIQLFDQSGVQVPTGVQFSAENGRFDVHAVAAGSYVIKAFSSAGPNQPLRAEVRVNLASDLHNLHLALAPALSIPVVVGMDSQVQRAKGPHAIDRMSMQGPPVSVRLMGSGPGSSESYASFDGPQNQQNLVLHNVEPGRYSAVIDARASWYVASAEYGQTNLLTDDLVITPGAPPLPLNIELRNDSARLTGTVHVPDGMTSQVTIVAVPDPVGKASPGVTNYFPPRDKNAGAGEFVFASLAPGDYLVFAFDHIEGIEYANPEVLQNYVPQATHVMLSPSQHGQVTLELIRTGEASN